MVASIEHLTRKVRKQSGEPRLHCLPAGMRSRPTAEVDGRGERGVLLFHEGHEVDVPGHPVDVVNGLGAGDAFVAAFVQSLQAQLPLEEAARRGSVAGAMVAAQLACSEAMPTLEELEAELA